MRKIALATAFIALAAATAQAQDGAMKTCGEKWQAVKAAGQTAGRTWPKFLSECRAELAAAPKSAADKPAPAPEKARASTEAAPATGRAPTGDIVFPKAIAEKYAGLPPAQARRKTCGEQFKANKAAKANGGLAWIEKGGGYWSQCNRKLKA